MASNGYLVRMDLVRCFMNIGHSEKHFNIYCLLPGCPRIFRDENSTVWSAINVAETCVSVLTKTFTELTYKSIEGVVQKVVE